MSSSLQGVLQPSFPLHPVLSRTRVFALRLYELLKDLDPLRWHFARKENLRQRVLLLKSQVQELFEDINAHAEAEWERSSPYPLSVLQERLTQIEGMLSALAQMDLNDHLSYFALRTLRKRLQKVYNQLCLLMEASQAPIPHIRPSNLARSSFHFLSAMAILAMIELVPTFSYMFWIALAYFVFCWTVEGLKRMGPQIKEKIMAFFARIAHPHEYDKVNSATWYGTALLLLSLTDPAVGVLAVTILGVADPMAASVGRTWGRIPLPGNRTLEGSLGFVVSGTLAGTLALQLLHPLQSLTDTLVVAAFASLCGAVAELAGNHPDDNLTIPVASAVGALCVFGFMGYATHSFAHLHLWQLLSF